MIQLLTTQKIANDVDKLTTCAHCCSNTIHNFLMCITFLFRAFTALFHILTTLIMPITLFTYLLVEIIKTFSTFFFHLAK